MAGSTALRCCRVSMRDIVDDVAASAALGTDSLEYHTTWLGNRCPVTVTADPPQLALLST